MEVQRAILQDLMAVDKNFKHELQKQYMLFRQDGS